MKSPFHLVLQPSLTSHRAVAGDHRQHSGWQPFILSSHSFSARAWPPFRGRFTAFSSPLPMF